MMRLLALVALDCCLAAGDRTLLTKGGEVFKGRVSQSGDQYMVDTPGGLRRFSASDVGCVFEDPHEIVLLADERFAAAKRVYEEFQRLPEADRAKNEKVLAAIDMAQGAATLCNLVQPHCTNDDKGAILRNLPIILQFLRLCRGAATSEIAGAAAGSAPKSVLLAEVHFEYKPPPEAGRPWVHREELGPGLGSMAQDLLNPDPAKRLEAVKGLSHPPAAAHLATLLKVLEGERDPAVISLLSESLAWQDPAIVLKSLAWAKRETDPLKRPIAFAVARSAGDRAAFEFLVDWFTEAPPLKHEDRAAFGSAFRQYHAWSSGQLKELLTKQRNPKLQMEILRQFGAVGDKSGAPMLVKAISSYPRDAVVSLLKIGKPALPVIIEGCHSDQQETRKLCLWLCRKITTVNSVNAGTYDAWWAANKKTVAEEEKAWWEEQSKHGYAIPPAFFAPYDLPLEAIVN
jgi:hypothetical protein